MMGDAESITFRQDLVDGKRVVYVLEPWPQQALIASSFPRSEAQPWAAFAGHADDQLTILVENGRATYLLGPEDGRGTRLGTLVEGSDSYQPPPEIPSIWSLSFHSRFGD